MWPHGLRESRHWCFLTLKPGAEPLKALVNPFLDSWQYGATDPERVKQQNGWIELLRDGKASLSDLIDATERRYGELAQLKPPAFFLYVDQGEELYVRSEEHQRQRFSQVLAQGVGDPRLVALMSLRSDFLGALQSDEPLYAAHQKIDVPPLREAELREVVSQPARRLSARFDSEGLVDIITRRTAEDSARDAGALPLLSYTLDDMWTQMVRRGDGVLRLPAEAFEPGGGARRPCECFSCDPSGRRRGAAARLDPEACERARERRTDATPRSALGVHGCGVASRQRAGRLSASAAGHRYSAGRRDLCRNCARGDFSQMEHSARVAGRGARVPHLEKRIGGGSPTVGAGP